LDTIPTNIRLVMNSKEFRTALRSRLFLKQEDYREGSHCDCKDHPLLDKYGHHITYCSKHGFCKQTHDSLVVDLNSLLRYSGYITKMEERNIFVNGPFTDREKNRRPDISINNYPNLNTLKLCLDVTVRSTLQRNQNGELKNVNVNNVGTAANIAYAAKVTKYGPICTANDFSFKPIVVETNGFVHEDTRNFFKSVSNKCSQINKIPHENMYLYFMKCLSVRLQIGMAKAINRRSHLLAGQNQHDEVFNDRLVFEDYQDNHEVHLDPM